jgi:hypothetical protein
MAYGQTQQTVSAQEAGRPQPQTSVEAAGGPFIRHSQPGRASQYSVSGTAFGGLITQPLVARPGYFRNFRITHQATGGVNGSVTVAAAADAPFNVSALTTLRDAFGTPLIVADGFSASYLIPMLSGGFGLNNGTNFPQNLVSYSAVSTGSTGTGNFTYSYALPLEFSKGYGCLSAANASLLPSLQIQMNSSAQVYTTAPGTLPTINTTCDTDFYWLPEGVNVEPPGLGTTRQYLLQQLNPTIATGGSARMQFPRLGGFLSEVTIIARNSLGARIDEAYPTGTGRVQLYVDGVPMIDSTVNEVYDDMNIAYGLGTGLNNATRPTGVMSFSRKTSMAQSSLGLLDTGEAYLSSNPGTLLEFNITTAQTFSSGPATFSALIGQVVPTGALIQGLPSV